jgi:hypothetical protein
MFSVVILAAGAVQIDEPIQTRAYAIIDDLTSGKQLRVPILNGYMPRIKVGTNSDGTDRIDYDYRGHVQYTGKVYDLKRLDVAKAVQKQEDICPPPLRAKKEKDEWMIRPSDVLPGRVVGPTYGK